MSKKTCQPKPLAAAIQPQYTTAPIDGPASHGAKPETYRMPKRGGDPFFGLTRGWYYQADDDDALNLAAAALTKPKEARKAAARK